MTSKQSTWAVVALLLVLAAWEAGGYLMQPKILRHEEGRDAASNRAAPLASAAPRPHAGAAPGRSTASPSR